MVILPLYHKDVCCGQSTSPSNSTVCPKSPNHGCKCVLCSGCGNRARNVRFSTVYEINHRWHPFKVGQNHHNIYINFALTGLM